MRFMLIVKSSKECQTAPSKDVVELVATFNQQMHEAGVLVELSRLQPTASGARVKLSGGKRTVVDGPFAETKELIGGFWIIDVESKQEAIDWALRSPVPAADDIHGEIEVRRLHEDDLPAIVTQKKHAAAAEVLGA